MNLLTDLWDEENGSPWGGQCAHPQFYGCMLAEGLHKLPPLEGRHVYLTMYAAAFPGPHKALWLWYPLGKILTDFARTVLSLKHNDAYRGSCLKEEGYLFYASLSLYPSYTALRTIQWGFNIDYKFVLSHSSSIWQTLDSNPGQFQPIHPGSFQPITTCFFQLCKHGY